MKQILIIAVLAITLFGCTKHSKTETLTVEQLKTKYGIDLIAAWDNNTILARSNGKGKPNKNDQVTLVEGNFTWDGGSFTTSDNPKFAGENNQTTIVSICNWFFWEGTPAQTLTCGNSTGSGQIMAWYTDWSDNVYRSNLITIP